MRAATRAAQGIKASLIAAAASVVVCKATLHTSITASPAAACWIAINRHQCWLLLPSEQVWRLLRGLLVPAQTCWCLLLLPTAILTCQEVSSFKSDTAGCPGHQGHLSAEVDSHRCVLCGAVRCAAALFCAAVAALLAVAPCVRCGRGGIERSRVVRINGAGLSAFLSAFWLMPEGAFCWSEGVAQSQLPSCIHPVRCRRRRSITSQTSNPMCGRWQR